MNFIFFNLKGVNFFYWFLFIEGIKLFISLHFFIYFTFCFILFVFKRRKICFCSKFADEKILYFNFKYLSYFFVLSCSLFQSFNYIFCTLINLHFANNSQFLIRATIWNNVNFRQCKFLFKMTPKLLNTLSKFWKQY